MTTTTQIDLVINKLTSAQYASATKNANELYLTTDGVLSSSDVTTALGYTPQEALVSGTNIKTINTASLLGSGNLSVAETDLSNVTSAGKSIGSSWAMPSNTGETLTVSASGSQHTAPANGWFIFRVTPSSANSYSYCNVYVVGSSPFKIAYSTSYGGTTTGSLTVWMPVKEGDKVQCDYGGGTIYSAIFYYAQGEV